MVIGFSKIRVQAGVHPVDRELQASQLTQLIASPVIQERLENGRGDQLIEQGGGLAETSLLKRLAAHALPDNLQFLAKNGFVPVRVDGPARCWPWQRLPSGC